MSLPSLHNCVIVASVINETHTVVIPTADVARRLKLSRATVNRWAANGTLPTLGKFPGPRGPYVFDAAAIERVATERVA